MKAVVLLFSGLCILFGVTNFSTTAMLFFGIGILGFSSAMKRRHEDL